MSGEIVENLLGMSISEISPWIIVAIIAVMLWKFIWYGIALYKTIERKQIKWFVVLFVATFLLNDLGLLAIAYLLIHKQKSPKKKK